MTPSGTREQGRPTSSNGASSMHLRWELPPDLVVVEASAMLTVVVAPSVNQLYFWALQASFRDGSEAYGAAHLGFQWHPNHPLATAANFGGYLSSGGELIGSPACRPPVGGNPNTCDFDWEPGRPYRLTIAADGKLSWAGLIDGQTLRTLSSPGDRLADLMVWSEVFARCDDPQTSVRWSDFEVVTADGDRLAPERLTVTYQSVDAGGCSNTAVRVDDDGFLQLTNTPREVEPGTVLPVSRFRAR